MKLVCTVKVLRDDPRSISVLVYQRKNIKMMYFKMMSLMLISSIREE